MKSTDILYSINVEDVQQVARAEYDRELKSTELKAVVDKLGDHIDWYQAVSLALADAMGKGQPSQ